METNQKLYIVTRRDLRPGAQAVQACHAFREFISKHPDLEADWYKTSNYMCLLSVENELALVELMHRATALGLKWAVFQEPDFDDEITALVLEPTPAAKTLCENLPLAFTEFNEHTATSKQQGKI